MREIEVVIDTEELAEFIYEQLLIRGYVPSDEEVDEVADIVFDYLLTKQVVEEVWEEEEED
ncbi:YozD family protein [Bacillus suaedaesalsae]|uniref:YozD family protein n=1 Tax=Bacillus suaedaesalsae TaxID=2810349 RepID=A0ABS2DLL6_9BACI|nr:YozD family protein [Bacillus suaedaesalsae]